ncbi:MAG: DUF2177 family protein [Hyphomicrobiaceae bacterium]
MKTFLSAYAATAVCMLVLDVIWLSTMAGRLYRPLLGDLLAADFRLAPAFAFYVLYVAGIVLLAVLPALDAARWQTAAFNGLVLGLVAYATYDLTNQATLRSWPAIITAIDMTWGAFLTSTAALAGYFGALALRS